jgi:hypothetical protein
MNTDSLIEQVQQQTEDLVKRGGDLRAETAKLVEDASGPFHAAAGGLSALVKAVADGAVAGAKQTLPADTGSVLGSVVDGITDGLTKSAQAVKLTLEESTASGTRFAHEDLAKIGQDFRTLGTTIADIIKGAASALGGHAKEQASTLASHAKQTLQAAWPPVESALAAAGQNPVQLGRETVNAGAAAAKQAAGVLFSEVGNLLQKAGQKLRE